MSATCRIVSVSMVSAVALGTVAAIDAAPPATALNCNAPEANVAPPPGQAFQLPDMPPPPAGRKPRGANLGAPLPKLGPLISSLIRLNPQFAAPVQQQAAAVPPAPNPAGAVDQAAPQVGPPVPNAAVPQTDSAPDPTASIDGSTTSLAEWVTGPNGPNKTLARFGISGTDLGIPWDNGDPANRQVLMAFGDTFGYCRVHGEQWRRNVLLRSQSGDLSHGIAVPDGVVGNQYSGSPLQVPTFSKQIIPAHKLAPTQESMIPTAGIAVGGNQYLNFMSVKQWLRDGDWSTNYSALAVSRDNGENWGIYPGTIRSSAPENVPAARYIPGNENFQQGAFLRGGDGYLYSFGTPAARGGSAYLSRVPEQFVPDLSKYQYWNESGTWVPANPAAATPVIPGPVGEMSVQYNTYLKRFLMLYGNGANSVVARTAAAPQGPWSAEQTLVSSGQMPGGIYAPFLHPWSTGKDVYFMLSLWNAYDVMLMHTVLG